MDPDKLEDFDVANYNKKKCLREYNRIMDMLDSDLHQKKKAKKGKTKPTAVPPPSSSSSSSSSSCSSSTSTSSSALPSTTLPAIINPPLLTSSATSTQSNPTLQPTIPHRSNIEQQQTEIETNKLPDGNFLDLPCELLGLMNDLCPTQSKLKPNQLPMIRKAFLAIGGQLREDRNIQNPLWWKKLLCFPRAICAPTHDGLSTAQRIKWICEDDWDFFCLKNFKTRTEHPRNNDNGKRHIKRATTLLRQGEISRADRALQNENPGRVSINESHEQLKKLHPTPVADDSLPPVPSDLPAIEITSDLAFSIIRRAPRSSTPCGTFSFRNEFLKDLVGSGTSTEEENCLELFTWIFNMIANNLLPLEIMNVLKDTQGITIPKKK
jgi:hypothetical protein